MRAKQPVYINEISFDALIDSSEEYTANAPSYPVEEGFSVSDSVILEPLQLSMTLYVTNTPVTWRSQHGHSKYRVEQVVNELIELYRKKEIITVETTDKTYNDLVITSISIAKSVDVGYAREIPITFNQVTITEVKITEISSSYGKSGQSGASVGKSSTKTEGNGKTFTASLFDTVTGWLNS